MAVYSTLINVSQLKDLLSASACRVVDCRFNLMAPGQGREEYLAGHIPGAAYAHLDEDLASEVTSDSGRHPLPDVGTLVKKLAGWGIGNDMQVVAYDHANGSVAARLWWLLRWLGHDNVAVLNGGFAAWTSSGGALSTTNDTTPTAAYLATPRAEMVATTGEIVTALQADDELQLVDARDAARFAGEEEPIDSVAGHIPGALNLPFATTVGADGRWRDRPELAAAWDKLLPEGAEKPLVAMCGSGVTACHLLISARLAGRREPRLYVGSWSEWIRDPKRPVETGNGA